ncbi:MAG: ATP-binding protein [Gammaproteobacteria bacterium]|nr:ATP-binding protein [Gammaproteobacteria bacterium]
MTMNWIANSLNRKFFFGTAVGLLLSSLVFLLLYIQLYRAELTEERSRSAWQINSLLQTSLENAMLKRDLSGLTEVVLKLGQQQGITTVFITNPIGEIRFASSPELVGKKLPDPYRGRAATTRFVENHQGQDVLRSINPVSNRSPCIECHGPIETNPINGILYVDYDAAPLRNKVQQTTLLLMGAGALIVVLNLTGGWLFIRRYILKPVNHLTQSSEALTQGNLTDRVSLSGHDEFARLGKTFNFMADKLQSKLQEIDEQRQFLQSLVDAIPDGVRIIDQTFNVILTNHAYRNQLALVDETGVGQTCYLIAHDRDKPCPPTLISCPLHEILKKQLPMKVLHRHHRKDGSLLDVEIYAAPMDATIDGERQTLVVESIRDLTQEIKYSQEQRLSELGRLATGVAHEIHNPLASVKLALDATEKALTDCGGCPDHIAGNLRLVDHEIDECIQITGKLLKLGALPSESAELVDINAALHETLSLLNWQAEENHIQILETYAPTLLRVLAAESELRMVALNLAQNAFHAMPVGGELRVSTQIEDAKILIRFKDTGAGILEKDLPYIFDPFFSRRADDAKGTGLGLSISLAIIEKYGGTIEVKSQFSVGSEFTITLPDASQQLGERL